jgi:hypothetical protein
MSLRLKQMLVKAKGMVFMSSPMNIKEHLDIGHQTVRNEDNENAPNDSPSNLVLLDN